MQTVEGYMPNKYHHHHMYRQRFSRLTFAFLAMCTIVADVSLLLAAVSAPSSSPFLLRLSGERRCSSLPMATASAAASASAVISRRGTAGAEQRRLTVACHDNRPKAKVLTLVVAGFSTFGVVSI